MEGVIHYSKDIHPLQFCNLPFTLIKWEFLMIHKRMSSNAFLHRSLLSSLFLLPKFLLFHLFPLSLSLSPCLVFLFVLVVFFRYSPSSLGLDEVASNRDIGIDFNHRYWKSSVLMKICCVLFLWLR